VFLSGERLGFTHVQTGGKIKYAVFMLQVGNGKPGDSELNGS